MHALLEILPESGVEPGQPVRVQPGRAAFGRCDRIGAGEDREDPSVYEREKRAPPSRFADLSLMTFMAAPVELMATAGRSVNRLGRNNTTPGRNPMTEVSLRGDAVR